MMAAPTKYNLNEAQGGCGGGGGGGWGDGLTLNAALVHNSTHVQMLAALKIKEITIIIQVLFISTPSYTTTHAIFAVILCK